MNMAAGIGLNLRFLEWYRSGFSHEELIAETLALLAELSPTTPAQRVEYGALFAQCTGLNPHTASAALARILRSAGVEGGL